MPKLSLSRPLTVELRGTGDTPPVAILWGGTEIHYIERVGQMEVLKALLESINKRLDTISNAIDETVSTAQDLERLWVGGGE